MAAVSTNTTPQGEAKKFENICPTEEELRFPSHTDNVCPIKECGKSLHNSSALKLHLVKAHKVGTEKDMWLFNKSSSRLATSHVDRRFYCPVEGCPRNVTHRNRPFKKMSMLKLHYMNVHAEKIFNCSKCKKSFGNPKRLSLHEATCGRLFTCSCGTPYSTKEALLTHARRKSHNVTVETKVKESKCSYKTVTLMFHCKQSLVPILPKPNTDESTSSSTSNNKVLQYFGNVRNLNEHSTKTVQTNFQHESSFGRNASSQIEDNVFDTARRIQKHTSEVSDEVAEAFTQTRMNIVENQSCQTHHGSVRLDNHTQTPISFNEYLLNFDNDFTNSSVRDLASACTQTSDSTTFRELLDYSTQEAQTQASLNDFELVEMNHSCTQTLFNELMSANMTDSNDLTISNDMETQTYVFNEDNILCHQSLNET